MVSRGFIFPALIRNAGLAVFALVVGSFSACWPGTPPSSALPPVAATRELPRIVLTTARRQTSFIPLDGLHLPAVAARLRIDRPQGPAGWPGEPFAAFTQRVESVRIESPAVDQLVGTPSVHADAGSTLIPAVATPIPGGAIFATSNASAVVLRLDVPAALRAGTYRSPVQLLSASPSAAAEAGTPSLPALVGEIEITVSDITLPAEPPVFTLATTSTADLAALYPATFGAFQANYLDRGDAGEQGAIGQLDALVQLAQRHGIALFVEDLTPVVRIDDVGHVLIDWDAYDRTVFPYMDGSAFADRVPLAVWLVPVPPGRIRDMPVQLRQYWQACLDHFKEKGWHAAPVLMHPALLDPTANPALARQIADMIEKDLEKSAIVLGTPDLRTDHPRMWAVHDGDPRLPPAEELAMAESVRVWPWMCHARGLAGMAWLNAVGRPEQPLRPSALFAAIPNALGGIPTVRLEWLAAGLNDSAHFGLLAQRSDRALAAEVLAGVVGRTGLGGVTFEAAPIQIPILPPPTGYLYAGWPGEGRVWAALPAIIDELIAANAPGANVRVAPNDPLLLAAKMWLAEAHRVDGRVAGYQFGINPSREGPILSAGIELLVENPLGAPAQLEVAWKDLPGDLQLLKDNRPGAGKLGLPAHGLVRHTARVAGHIDVLPAAALFRPMPMELGERTAGAVLELPVMLPVYRMHATREPPAIDGRGKGWSTPANSVLSGIPPMPVAVRYLSRRDVLKGDVRLVDAADAATVRWTYDAASIYALITCPQPKVSDQRTSQWPLTERRWWGTDGVQIQIAGGPRLEAAVKVVQIGIKPSGTVLTKSATVFPGEQGGLRWVDGPTGLKYGIAADGRGYTVELAIPRKWFASNHDQDPNVPCWRVNVLRLRHDDEAGDIGTSWSGPVVDDSDVAMMGLLLGGE